MTVTTKRIRLRNPPPLQQNHPHLSKRANSSSNNHITSLLLQIHHRKHLLLRKSPWSDCHRFLPPRLHLIHRGTCNQIMFFSSPLFVVAPNFFLWSVCLIVWFPPIVTISSNLIHFLITYHHHCHHPMLPLTTTDIVFH